MNFFNTLLHPDHEEHPDRAEVVHAANLLQIGEFQLLQLAFADWFGRDMSSQEADRVFDSFMLRSEVPPWARHYARRIIELDAGGALDENSAAYHRYDCDYFKTRIPDGMRRFVVAVTILAGLLGGGIAMASYTAKCDGVLPPCFDGESETPNWGRADGVGR